MTSLFAAGCAVAPADDRAEAPGTADEAILIRLQHVSLKLDATVHRVATASGAFGIKEVQYFSFHVANTGTTNAAASQIAITCAMAAPPLNFGPAACASQPVVVGLPAIAAGGFFDFSWPNRALEIGAGTDSNVWVPSGMSLDETITARVQSSGQIVDPTIGTVVLHDGCDGNAACAAVPAAPSPSPAGQGLLGTPLQFGYFYSWFTPTWLELAASGPDHADLGATPVHAGETLRIDVALLQPSLGWSYVSPTENVSLYLDGVLVATPPASGLVTPLDLAAPPYDAATHTLRATFGGDGPLAPTVSRVYSFTLVP